MFFPLNVLYLEAIVLSYCFFSILTFQNDNLWFKIHSCRVPESANLWFLSCISQLDSFFKDNYYIWISEIITLIINYLNLKSESCNTVYIYLFILHFIYLYFKFLAALGLHCCARAFSSCGERGRGWLLFVVVCGLLIVVASLVAEHGL